MTPENPVPWWKRPGVWLVAAGAAVLAFVFAFLRPPMRPLVSIPLAPPPPPPAPPDVPIVKIPQVDTKPADGYEASKVTPSSDPTDAEVDAALARLNATDTKGTP
jgi:hypothetical protein